MFSKIFILSLLTFVICEKAPPSPESFSSSESNSLSASKENTEKNGNTVQKPAFPAFRPIPESDEDEEALVPGFSSGFSPGWKYAPSGYSGFQPSFRGFEDLISGGRPSPKNILEMLSQGSNPESRLYPDFASSNPHENLLRTLETTNSNAPVTSSKGLPNLQEFLRLIVEEFQKNIEQAVKEVSVLTAEWERRGECIVERAEKVRDDTRADLRAAAVCVYDASNQGAFCLRGVIREINQTLIPQAAKLVEQLAGEFGACARSPAIFSCLSRVSATVSGRVQELTKEVRILWPFTRFCLNNVSNQFEKCFVGGAQDFAAAQRELTQGILQCLA